MFRNRSIQPRCMSRSGISRSSLVIGGVLWVCVLIAVALVARRKGTDNDQHTIKPSNVASEQTAENTVPVAGESNKSVRISFPAKELPDFEFPECMGGTVSRDSLKGRPWVASFVFTRCTTTCPMITKAMMDLQKELGDKNTDVQFVTFSVDSNYDTPEILKKYSENFSANHDRWKFLTGEESAIHNIIIDGFSLYVKPNAGEARLPGFEVAHSNRVVLVNEDSIPVATFLGTREEDMLELRRILEGKREFPKPAPGVTPESTSGAAPEIMIELTPEKKSGETPDTDSSNAPSDDAGVNLERAPEYQLTSYQQDSTAGGEGAVADETRNAKIDRLMPSWTKIFPSLNATLNSISTMLLLGGFVAIKAGRRLAHRNAMIGAFLVSVVFLGSYLTYHYLMGKYSGEHGRQFEGSVTATRVYFAILIPHVLLAAAVPFMAIRVFQHAFKERWEQHRKLAKIAFPIWLFVSVTGVVIYWMLYHWPWKDSIPVPV